MIGRLKNNWQEFTESKPGERFKNRYYRRQQDGPSHVVARIFWIILGTLIAVGSLFTAPLPGPGFATVFLGLAILAGELLPAARLLDWSEVWIRQLWQFVRDVWRASLWGKVSLVVIAAILASGFLYFAYLLLFCC